jgi:hypothetical protein
MVDLEKFEGMPKKEKMHYARKGEKVNTPDYNKVKCPKDKTKLTGRLFNRKNNNPLKKSHIEDCLADELAEIEA